MSADNLKSDIVSVTEAAARLGKSERTVHRMITSGKLASVDIGGKRLVQMGFSGDDNILPEADSKTVQVSADERLLRDKLEAQYQEAQRIALATIEDLRAENKRLWSMMQSMLPPPGESSSSYSGKYMPWLLAVCLLAVIAVVTVSLLRA